MAKKKQPHTDRQASVVTHSLRCGARTRKGTPCKLPAKQDGRCWMHGKIKAESLTKEFDKSVEIIPEVETESESSDEQLKSDEKLSEVGDLALEREKDTEIDADSTEIEPVIELEANAIDISEVESLPETEELPDQFDRVKTEPQDLELKPAADAEPDTDRLEIEPVIELDADALEILETDIQPETDKPLDSEETEVRFIDHLDSMLESLDDTGTGSDFIEIEPVIALDVDSLEISTDGIQPELEKAPEPEEIIETETNELKLEMEAEPEPEEILDTEINGLKLEVATEPEPEEILDTEINGLQLEMEAEPDADSKAVIDAYDDAEAKLQVEAEEPPIYEDDLHEEFGEDWIILDQELGADTGTEEVLDEQEPEPEPAELKLKDGYAGKSAVEQVAAEELDDFTRTVEIALPKTKLERTETEKSQKPDVGLVKKAFAVSEKLRQLREKQFTVSLLYMIIAGLVVCIVFGAYAFNRLEPKIQDDGNLRITAMDIQSKVVNNFESGDLFVITGRVINEYDEPRSFISVTGKLFIKNDFSKTKTIYCGNVLPEEELSILSPADIKKLLSEREGEKQSNVNVKPGQILPFMIVFFNLPDNLEDLDRFSISISRSSPQSK